MASRLVHGLWVLVFLAMLLPSSTSANAIYQYSGNLFDTFSGTGYDSSMSIFGQFELAAPLGSNLPLTDITASIISYSFSDGLVTLTDGNSTIIHVQVATGGVGEIVGPWDFWVETPDHYLRTVADGDPFGAIDEAINFLTSAGASVADNRGTWSIVPEPSTAILLGWGCVGFAIARRDRRPTRR